MRFAAAFLIAALLCPPALAQTQSSASTSIPVAPTAKEDPAVARAKRLDVLLGRLHKTPVDQNTAAIESEIWEIWSRNASATAEVLLQESTAAINAGDLAPAEQMLSQLTETYPQFAAGWARRAFLYRLLDRPDAALIDIDHALDLEPRDYLSYGLKGLILIELKRTDEALVAMKQALAINPHFTGVDAAIKKLEHDEPHA